MLATLPDDKSSTPITAKPSRAIRAATCEPMNPATPVTTTFKLLFIKID
jgi:hypothetical protein